MPKILIVDRDPVLAERLTRALEAQACEVRRNDSMTEAERLVQAEPPDLLLFNSDMAGGSDLLRPDSPFRVLALTESAVVDQVLQRSGIPAVERHGSLAGILIAIRNILGLADPVPVEGQRVLIADDDPQIADILERFFRRRGLTMDIAVTGREAIDLVKGGDPAIAAVLLDVILPDLDGLTTLREIIGHSTHPGVIMISAVSDAGIARQAREYGAFDYVLKPFDPGFVAASLSAAINDFEYRTRTAGGVSS